MNPNIPNWDRQLEKVFTLSQDIIQRLELSRIPWAFFAGVAARFYGVNRAINDIDIIFQPELNRQTVQTFQDFEIIEKRESALVLSHNQTELVSGHLTYASDGNVYEFTFDKEMIARRKKAGWGGTDFYFISPEDTITLKAILMREIHGTEFDVEDIKTIAQNIDLDLWYMEFRGERCHAEDRLALIIEDIRRGRLP